MTTDATTAERSAVRRLGVAWVMLWIALAAHVFDEAMTGFLAVYNPTVLALRERLGFWPMPTFEFREWLAGLSVGIVTRATLSPFAFRNARWLRPLFYFCAIVVGVLNALGHMATTIFGHPLSGIGMPRPSPGFYSSPMLLAAAVYALGQLRRTRQT
jgi:hypothetical protein